MHENEPQFDGPPDPELSEIHAQLRVALHASATPPAVGLADRIEVATRLADLGEALRVEAPAGLAGLVYAATAHRLRRRSVLARIGPASTLVRIAAVVTLLASVSLPFYLTARTHRRERAVNAYVALADGAAGDFAGGDRTRFLADDLDAQIVVTTAELDRLAMSDHDGPLEDLRGDAEQLSQDLLLMEAEIDVL